MVATFNWLLAHWWVFFFLSAFGVFESVRDFFLSLAEGVAGIVSSRREHQLELERARHSEMEAPPAPGRCRHRQVRQVRDRDDNLVAWLCTGCDAQLPADWAVAKEDL